jgi:hypothetical protein
MPPYPANLIPQTTDLVITEANLNTTELLCRWVSANVILKDQTGSLNAEAIELRRLFDFSVNKIPPSIVDDIFIQMNDNEEFNQSWEQGTPGRTPTEDEFFYDTTRQYFLFKISDIHLYAERYRYPINAVHKDYTFRVHAVHRPLISNISHFELLFNFFQGDTEEFAKVGPNDKVKKIIAADLRIVLIKKSKFTLESFE